MSDTVFFTRPEQRASLAKMARTRILTLAIAAGALVREWRRNYRSRRELASYSFDQRRDLGFAGDVDMEIAKPFWSK